MKKERILFQTYNENYEENRFFIFLFHELIDNFSESGFQYFLKIR